MNITATQPTYLEKFNTKIKNKFDDKINLCKFNSKLRPTACTYMLFSASFFHQLARILKMLSVP